MDEDFEEGRRKRMKDFEEENECLKVKISKKKNELFEDWKKMKISKAKMMLKI